MNKKNILILILVILIILVIVLTGIKILFSKQEETVPSTNNNSNEIKNYWVSIEEISTKSKEGIMVKGTVEKDTIHINDEIQIITTMDEFLVTKINNIKINDEDVTEASVGDTVELTLKTVDIENIDNVFVLAAPYSLEKHTSFLAEMYIYTPEEGGRHTSFYNNYRPQFEFPASRFEITGVIQLQDEIEEVFPGDTLKMKITLITPVPMEVGHSVTIIEGGRNVGTGTILEIYE